MFQKQNVRRFGAINFQRVAIVPFDRAFDFFAIKQNEHLTRNFLEWFVNEQLEEVSSMDTLLRMIRRAGEQGLMFVESHLARKLHGGAGEAGA